MSTVVRLCRTYSAGTGRTRSTRAMCPIGLPRQSSLSDPGSGGHALFGHTGPVAAGWRARTPKRATAGARAFPYYPVPAGRAQAVGDKATAATLPSGCAWRSSLTCVEHAPSFTEDRGPSRGVVWLRTGVAQPVICFHPGMFRSPIKNPLPCHINNNPCSTSRQHLRIFAKRDDSSSKQSRPETTVWP